MNVDDAGKLKLKRENPLQLLWRSLIRNPATLMGSIVILLMLSVALLAPLVAPYSFKEMHVQDRLKSPGLQYLLGTDEFGRDTLSRILYGSRVSMAASILAVAIAMLVGTVLGSLAGFEGGWLDEILMRIMDMIMAFPYIVLAITLVTILGPGFRNVILIIGILRIPHFARMSRSSVLALKNEEFVLAAQALGQTKYRVLFRHILPNCLTPLVVVASLAAGTAITAESALSFLGLGIQPPMSSWGTMLADGQKYLFNAPWMATFPGIAITLTVLAYNLVGDGLRDILDPKFRR
jgi:ABC-type dipeptide/oligopeptide/nickel transport system permease subunit